MAMPRTDAFELHLRRAGVPITGLSWEDPAGPTTVTINFAPEATAEQILWANEAKASFDWRPRRFLADGAIAQAFAGLTAQQQSAFQRRLLARFLQQNEQWVADLAAEFGVALPYDEVAP